MKQDSFDLMCLKALKVNAESEGLALTAASIVVHAHAIARDAPDRADEARRIIALTRRFYAAMPSREGLCDIVDDFLAEIAAGTRAGAARERLVERIWRYLHHGTGP